MSYGVSLKCLEMLKKKKKKSDLSCIELLQLNKQATNQYSKDIALQDQGWNQTPCDSFLATNQKCQQILCSEDNGLP